MIKRSVKSQVRQQFKYGENILKTVAKYFFQSAYAYVLLVQCGNQQVLPLFFF
jgi:hypothetical protein